MNPQNSSHSPVPDPALGHGEEHGHVWYQDASESDFFNALVVVIMVAMALLFEALWHRISHNAAHSYKYGDASVKNVKKHHSAHDNSPTGHKRLMEELANRTGSEFMTLGFLAFCIFLLNTSGSFRSVQAAGCALFGPQGKILKMHCPHEAEQWLHLCEWVHMKIFIGMVLYLLTMQRVAWRSVEQMKQWEEFHEQREQERQCVPLASRAPSLELVEEKLDVYLTWRSHFVTDAMRWKYSRPDMFSNVLENLGIERGDDEQECFRAVLDRRFDFSAYLAHNLEDIVSDSIHFHESTWLMTMAMFALLAFVHAFLKLTLLQLKGFFMLAIFVLVAVMRCVVMRAERHISSAELVGLETMPNRRGEAPAAPVPQARSSMLEPEMLESGETAAEVMDSAEAQSVSKSDVALQDSASQASSDVGASSAAFTALIPWVHERYQTELFAMRALQIVLFLLSYMFASTLLDVLGLLCGEGPAAYMEETRHTIAVIVAVVYFFGMFTLLMRSLPGRVVRFLAIAAMPPYVDADNVTAFLKSTYHYQVQVDVSLPLMSVSEAHSHV